MAGPLAENPTSIRGYLSRSELEQFADITITDDTEADDQISQAEELIDAYVGPQDKFIDHEITGMLSAGGDTSHTLKSAHQNQYNDDYFKGCYLEIIGGTAAGERQKITASTKAGVLTTDAFSTSTSTDSYYRIYQPGKFPRTTDIHHDTENSPNKYYKAIPEAVKRAVAAQIEYRINVGDAFFAGDKVDMTSESIGDYSYSKGGRNGDGVGIHKLIAPKARFLLRGIVNRRGRLIV